MQKRQADRNLAGAALLFAALLRDLAAAAEQHVAEKLEDISDEQLERGLAILEESLCELEAERSPSKSCACAGR